MLKNITLMANKTIELDKEKLVLYMNLVTLQKKLVNCLVLLLPQYVDL